jgi:hypothetical protein
MLKAKIGAPEAEAFVQILEQTVDKKFDEKKDIIATKQDLADLEGRLLRTIYLTSVGQFIAIVASVVGLLFTLLKR